MQHSDVGVGRLGTVAEVDPDGLHRRLRVATSVSDVVRLLVREPMANVEAALRAMGEALEADVATLAWMPAVGAAPAAPVSWHASPVDARGAATCAPIGWAADDARRFAWSLARLRAGDAVVVDDPATLRPEALAEREAMTRAGACSLLAVPLLDGDGALQGVLSIASAASAAWGAEDSRALRTVGDVLVALHGRSWAVDALREREEQLRQALKMEAVGQLAGGIAHDFNNLLTVIGASCELLGVALREEPPAPHEALLAEVQAIGDATRRAAELTRRLLAFSRKQALAPRVLGLDAVVHGLEQMMQRLVGADIELVVLGEQRDRPRVRADAGQLEQAILNLVLNARDAMPTGGVIVIEAGTQALAPHDARLPRGATPGRYAVLSVTDTGHGMNEVTLSRIFEPFFTTKPAGRGTGLGLPLVYGVASQLGGFVDVRSEPGRGTTFEVFLPEAGAEESGVAEVVRDEPAAPAWGAVLVVEDEATVRSAVSRVLRKAGFEVLEARHGADALRMLAARNPRDGLVRLVVTDVVMPEMGGVELAQRLATRATSPALLLMTGYPERVESASGRPRDMLAKPFTSDALIRAVRAALAGVVPAS